VGSDRSQLPRARTFGCPQPVSEFSLDKANALLDEAGWKAGADGIREKDGLRLSLKIAFSKDLENNAILAAFKREAGSQILIVATGYPSASSAEISIKKYTAGLGTEVQGFVKDDSIVCFGRFAPKTNYRLMLDRPFSPLTRAVIRSRFRRAWQVS